MTVSNKKSLATSRGLFAVAALATALAVQVSSANAVSLSVRYACMQDYFRYCSTHAVGSQALRHCMRVNGERLSRNCVRALVSAGEVSQAEVNRRGARMRTARAQ